MAANAERWSTLYKDSIVVDCMMPGPPSLTYVQEMIDAGITACNRSVSSRFDTFDQAINRIVQEYWLFDQTPQSTILVEKASDIEKAKKEGKWGIIFGFQGASAIGSNIQLIRIFHRLGVRIIQLTYMEANALAGGCLEPSDKGLTSLGIQAVREMNRVGIVIDLSHVGKRSSLEAIEISKDPVIFSHSNPRNVHDNPRNITDEQIKACVAKGGMIGVSCYSPFVGSTEGGRQPSLEEFFKHMDYLLNLVGPDHVGIGTDINRDLTDGLWFAGTTGKLWPEMTQGMTYSTRFTKGFTSRSNFSEVVHAMLDRGYEEAVIRKIIGGNWQRLFGRVWDKGCD